MTKIDVVNPNHEVAWFFWQLFLDKIKGLEGANVLYLPKLTRTFKTPEKLEENFRVKSIRPGFLISNLTKNLVHFY